MKRRVLETLKKKRKESRLHFTLIDPDKDSPRTAYERALHAKESGTDVILVGGSTGVHEPNLSMTVEEIKKIGLPVILFPGNINGLTPKADAVLFMVLLNSDDPYYLGGVQVQAAPIVLRMGLEPIPTTYIIVGHGGAAGYIGKARPIPYNHPELVAIHSLAGAMMGAQLIYLEAGSGAPQPVPPKAVYQSKRLLEASGLDPLVIVGGGVRDPQTARKLAEAGADGLVTGTLAEENPDMLKEVIEAFKQG